MQPTTKLFEPFAFAGGVTLRNRIAMAPMTTWSANDDRTISDQEDAYYRRRVKGVGLVITGCTHVTPSGIGFTDEFASYDDRFIPSLRRLADAAKSGGARAVLQIFHAGNKAAPELVPNGEVVAASDDLVELGPFSHGGAAPRALTEAEILAIVADFGQATRRAIEAGFDGVELHGAHGFLIQNFFSPYYNRRTDAWGGALENRLRFPLAVVREVRRVIDEHAKRAFLLGYRVSPEEPEEQGLRIDDTCVLLDRIIEAGVDYIHASLWTLLEAKPIGAIGDKTTAELVVEHVAGRVPVIAAGQIRTPDEAERAMALGLSIVAVGQGLVMNPDWVELARSGRVSEIATTLNPARVPRISLPAKLWTVIQATVGWFAIDAVPEPVASET
jgi:2,4-dienoyl-CoA reductase-like NADH-dependent reductase (Old Yellow Enzyme family)